MVHRVGYRLSEELIDTVFAFGIETQINCQNQIASLAEWSKAVDLSSVSTLLSKDA